MSTRGFKKNADGEWQLDAIDHFPARNQTSPIPMRLVKYEDTVTLGALGPRQGRYLTLTFQLAMPGEYFSVGMMSLN